MRSQVVARDVELVDRLYAASDGGVEGPKNPLSTNP